MSLLSGEWGEICLKFLVGGFQKGDWFFEGGGTNHQRHIYIEITATYTEAKRYFVN